MSAPADALMRAVAEAATRLLAAPPPGGAAAFALWTAVATEAGRAALDPVAGAALARFLDPELWLFGAETPDDPAIRLLLATPRGQDFGRAGLDDGPQARTLRAALAAHRALVAEAYGRMAARAAQEALSDPPADLAVAQARWVAAAAAERDALQGSAAFLAAQAAVVAAAVAMRQAEAAAVEAFCAERGLPTRAEVDALQCSVAELRRELRALKRAIGRP